MGQILRPLTPEVESSDESDGEVLGEGGNAGIEGVEGAEGGGAVVLSVGDVNGDGESVEGSESQGSGSGAGGSGSGSEQGEVEVEGKGELVNGLTPRGGVSVEGSFRSESDDESESEEGSDEYSEEDSEDDKDPFRYRRFESRRESRPHHDDLNLDNLDMKAATSNMGAGKDVEDDVDMDMVREIEELSRGMEALGRDVGLGATENGSGKGKENEVTPSRGAVIAGLGSGLSSGDFQGLGLRHVGSLARGMNGSGNGKGKGQGGEGAVGGSVAMDVGREKELPPLPERSSRRV